MLTKCVVHERGGLGVFEGFVRHDMAPVTGGIPDAEKDGFILPAGFFQGFRAPGIPVDRVMGVLEQVRRGGMDKMVGHG